LEETRNLIIGKAEELFLKYGIKSVTMDDISQELAISKKTIYQYFKDKDELVNTVARVHLEKEKEEITNISKQARNTLEEFMMLSRCIKDSHLKMNPVVFWDMKKYYHEAWEMFQEYKRGVFFESIKLALKRGVAEGYFRNDINLDVLAALRLEQIQMSYNENVFPPDKFNIVEVQKQLFEHFVHGILTEKGRNDFDEFFTIINQPLIP
jgi:TetR/AcrR family transcriptional regulator, cholesterol catabolism regulator